MSQFLERLYRTDDGVDLIEYALLGAFVVLVCVLAVINLGLGLDTALDSADAQLRSDGGL